MHFANQLLVTKEMKWSNPIMQAHNLCLLKQNNFCKVVILPKLFLITVFFKAIMFTLTVPCQVVNLQDIDAFARSNSFLLSILWTTARNCRYSRLYGDHHFVLIQDNVRLIDLRYSFLSIQYAVLKLYLNFLSFQVNPSPLLQLFGNRREIAGIED